MSLMEPRIVLRFRLSVILGAGVLLAATTAPAQDPPKEDREDYVKAHYTKFEYRIPMRDGK